MDCGFFFRIRIREDGFSFSFRFPVSVRNLTLSKFVFRRGCKFVGDAYEYNKNWTTSNSNDFIRRDNEFMWRYIMLKHVEIIWQ